MSRRVAQPTPWMGHGNFTTSSTGGTQGHTHNIATIDVWIWKRVA